MVIDRADRAVLTVDRHGTYSAVRTYAFALDPVCGNVVCTFCMHSKRQQQ